MLKVKICGITNVADALYSVDAGVDALGFIFHRESPRYVSPSTVRRIVERLPPFVTTVGVFVNEQPSLMQETMGECGLSLAQLHGDETPEDCRAFAHSAIKAIRVRNPDDIDRMREYSVRGFVLDAAVDGVWGGTGQLVNWELARTALKYGDVILAGGLTPDNVRSAVATVHPYGVDVSSGVEESPGKKDHQKVIRFVSEAKSARG